MTNRSSIAVSGVVLLGLLAGLWWSAPGFEAATRSTEAPAKMCGTVSALDRTTGELRLVTGVGHSLRVVVFRVGRECRVRVAGAEAALGDIARGQIVVVDYRKTPSGNTAESIETVRLDSDRGRP